MNTNVFTFVLMLSRQVMLGALLLAATFTAQAKVYHVAEMNTAELAALDRKKTVVIIPGGILEEHGPYLPSDTDGIISARLSKDVAEGLVAEGWNILVFPQLVLGSGGANEIASKYPYPGTYVIRLNTLRAVYMDLASELGDAGFKWIFMIHYHGAPNHNRILDEAAAYFSETYSGTMRHITGGFSMDNKFSESMLSEQARKEDASSGHAGIDETSLILFLRPDLVSPDYVNAPSLPADAQNGWMPGVAKKDGWPGYFGAPKFSRADYGGKLYAATLNKHLKQAIDVLAGKSAPITIRPRPADEKDSAAIQRDKAIEQRQLEWMKKKGIQ